LRRKFVTNLAFVLFLNLLIKPFWFFGIDRAVQNTVGAESYGLYLALFNFSLLFSIILDLGITNFNNKNIAQNNSILSKHLSNIVSMKFLMAIVYTIITIIIAFAIGWRDVKIYLLLFLIFNQFLSSFILYLRSNLSGLHLFKTDSIISILDKVLMIIIVGYLLLNPETNQKGVFKIEWFIYSQTLAYLATLLITFLILSRKLDFFTIRFDRTFFIAFFKKSYPYALLVLLMSFYNRTEPILLERLLPDSSGALQAGIYAQSYRILDVSSQFSLLFAGLLLPIFAKMIKQKEDLGELVQFSFSLIIIPAIILSIVSFNYSSEIMTLLYHEHIEISSKILGVLMLGFVFISTTYIFGTLLTANGSMKQLNIMASFGMLFNIGINFYLIPNYLAEGASYSSLLTQGITAFIQVFIAYKVFKFKINFKYLFNLLAFILIIVTIGYFSKEISSNWIINMSVFVISSLIIAFLTKLISLKSIYHIIKYDE
jgi:O-antigen/teichoic acid export membrane protein